MIHFELYALRGDGWTLDSWHDDRASALARAEAARARAGCRGVKVIRETYYPRRHAAHERVILDTTRRRRRPKPARPPAPAAVAAPSPSGVRAGPTRMAASLVGFASAAALAAATAAVIALT